MSFDRRTIPAIITTDLTNDGDPDNEHIERAPSGGEDVAFTATAVSPDEADRPCTPAIDIHLEPEASSSQHHHRSLSNPKYLTPILKTSHSYRPSLEVPGTPSLPSPGSDGSMVYPPSPTLSSHSSVHFQQPTSLSLRENNPDGKSGMESLQTLHSSHHRRGSSVSFVDSNDETDPDSHAKSLPSSHSGHRTEDALSPTNTHVGNEHELGCSEINKASNTPSRASSSNDRPKAEKKAPLTSEDPSPEPLDLSKDTTDPAPFAFKPLHLASLVDPKNLDTLRKMGGIDELLKGIGTDPRKGLSSRSLQEDELHAPLSPGNTPITSPNEASVSERRRVYGINYVPARKSKSLLQLMWFAFKDKILVWLFLYVNASPLT
jgi:P-type Ca2+ transporter type 2C